MKNILSGVIAAAEQNATISTEDYIGKDGLLICGTCHTPKQCRISFLGSASTVSCLCQCADEQWQAAEEAKRLRKEQQRIAGLRTKGTAVASTVTAPTNEALAVLAQHGDREAITALWEQTYPLVYMLLSRYYSLCPRCGIEAADLQQSGYFALLRAVEAYNPARGLVFNSYLDLHVRNVARETLGFTSSRMKLPPVMQSLSAPIGEDDNLTLADTLTDPDAAASLQQTDDKLYNDQLHNALEECLASLPQGQAEVLRMRHYERKTLKAVAMERDVYPETIRQMENKGLRQMRQGKNVRRLREFREDIMGHSLRMGGLSTFRASGYSSVEWAGERLMGDGA